MANIKDALRDRETNKDVFAKLNNALRMLQLYDCVDNISYATLLDRVSRFNPKSSKLGKPCVTCGRRGTVQSMYSCTGCGEVLCAVCQRKLRQNNG